MKLATFDKLAGAAILLSQLCTVVMAATTWAWFPTPGEWGDIARIPRSLENYVALLLPPVVLLLALLMRRGIVARQLGKK